MVGSETETKAVKAEAEAGGRHSLMMGDMGEVLIWLKVQMKTPGQDAWGAKKLQFVFG